MSWSNSQSNENDRPLSAEPVGMIAVDLDGTLLGSDGSINAPSAQALMEIAAKGIRVVLASGRSPQSMLRFQEALGLDSLMIAHNGAVVFDSIENKYHVHETMPGPTARRVVELARQVDQKVAVGVDVNGKTYTDTAKSQEATSKSNNAVGQLDKVLDRAVTKVMMVGGPDVLGGIMMSLQSKMADQVGFSFGDLKLLQVVQGGVDKAKALQYVANHYRVAQQGVMAVGDAPNDVGMIKWAGYGVALSNGWQEVRDAALCTCASNDNGGVAEAVKKFVM